MKISTGNLISRITVLPACLPVIIFLFVITKAEAQQLPKQKLYQLKIIRVDGATVKGYLHRIQDGSIYLNVKSPDLIPIEVKADRIKTIKVRTKGSIGRGLAIGAGTGALLGYIIGYASYEEPDCTGLCFDLGPETDGAAGMVFGILVGGLIGAIAGGSSKTFAINGNQDSFELIKPNIARYQVIYDPIAEVK